MHFLESLIVLQEWARILWYKIQRDLTVENIAAITMTWSQRNKSDLEKQTESMKYSYTFAIACEKKTPEVITLYLNDIKLACIRLRRILVVTSVLQVYT